MFPKWQRSVDLWPISMSGVRSLRERGAAADVGKEVFHVYHVAPFAGAFVDWLVVEVVDDVAVAGHDHRSLLAVEGCAESFAFDTAGDQLSPSQRIEQLPKSKVAVCVSGV